MRNFLKVSLFSLIFYFILNSLFFIPRAEANNKVYAVTFQGSDTGYRSMAGPETGLWDDLCLFDSILRIETDNVDTIISLWGWGQNDNMHNLIFFPKYRIPFIDGRASVAKLDTVTAWLAGFMDTTDILFMWLFGHGSWEQYPFGSGRYHSQIDATEMYTSANGLFDTSLAIFLNRIPCCARFIGFNACETFGKGNHPDSCGFATYLAIKSLSNNLHRKTVLFSGAGPQPAWGTQPCDDRAYQGGPIIDSLENERYNGYYYHAEFGFHILTGLNAGAEPSEYYSDSAPGFFFDSLDVIFGNGDSRISLGETFRWDRNRNSQLGFEDNQIVDSGGIRNRFIIWPRIEIVDSIDAGPTATFLPDSVDSGAVVTPQVWVKNYGLAIFNVPTRLRIGSIYNQVRNKFIGPNQEDTSYFPNWTANQSGWISVRCSTELIGDEKPSNNLLRDSIYVRPGQPPPPYPDVSVTAIVNIPDTCDFGDTLKPQVRVKNFGNTLVSFSVILRIGSIYTDVYPVINLAPNDSLPLTFSQWIAQSGTYLVKCSTALVNDSNPANDAKWKTMVVQPPAGSPEKWELVSDLSSLLGKKKIKGGAALCYDGSQFIYALTGNNRRKFLAYDLLAGNWTEKESVPLGTENKKIKDGSALVFYQNQVYAIKGSTFNFYRYDPTSDSWYSMGIVPGVKKIKKGSALTTDGNWIYLAKAGTKPGEFYRWRPDSGWVMLESIKLGENNKKLNKGAALCYLNGKIYLLKGNCDEFWAYDIAARTWLEDSIIPPSPSGKTKVKDGGALTVLDGNKIYAFKGGNTQDFYEYTPSGWAIRESISKGTSDKRVKAGGALCGALGKIYAFKGNNTYEFWCYTPASGSTFWSSLSPKAQAQSVDTYLLRSIVKLPTIIRLSDFLKYRIHNSRLLIYDYLGRKVGQIRLSGIYFLKQENQPMRKILILK
jgi:hypothetical protein